MVSKSLKNITINNLTNNVWGHCSVPLKKQLLNGTVSVISSDPPCKDSAMPDLQTKSDQKCGRNILFFWLKKCFFLVVSPLRLKNKECAITFAEKLQIKEQFKEKNKHNKLSRVPL